MLQTVLYHINTPAEIPAVIERNDKEKMDFQLIFFFFLNITLLTLFHSLNIVHIQNIMGTEYLYCSRHCALHKWTASNNRFYCCFFTKCRLHEGMKYRKIHES